jgi:hypothetical protein
VVLLDLWSLSKGGVENKNWVMTPELGVTSFGGPDETASQLAAICLTVGSCIDCQKKGS